MLRLVHQLVSPPAIYDLPQKLAGGDISKKILKQELSFLPKTGSALDVGGGTGLMRSLLPEAWEYACLDNNPQKLNGFQKKFPCEKTIQASATKIPKANNTLLYLP